MARLSVSEEEIQEWTPMLENIASWFDQLNAIDVEGVEPLLRASENGNTFRADQDTAFLLRSELVALTEMEDNYVKVPKVMGESEG
eukprot:CAMPEP_0114231842 /NCGR_PEP_ID=MMETSP0058-20121206/4275_1 /TAXON_ID=36894 /ORGANISM="Pyramimonas parkeae, CCMP726" /LENGTH=85 /DNA_ID=CAMNT_0001343249 /DNA_START=257 /DNA_END=514 /DNA_ORIENTATION=+